MEIIPTITETNFEIKIKGEVDASSAILLDQEFEKALHSSCNNILIDCEEMHYISSAGLGVFMSHIEECNEKNKNFVIYSMTEKIQSVFDMLGLNNLITIKEDKQSAINYINER